MQIEAALTYNDLSHYEKTYFDLCVSMRSQISQNNPLHFLHYICQAQSMHDQLTNIENKHEFQMICDKFKEIIGHMIDLILKKPDFFFKFAYYLRMKDSDEKNGDYFTKKFIVENARIYPIWKEIIQSNRWVQV